MKEAIGNVFKNLYQTIVINYMLNKRDELSRNAHHQNQRNTKKRSGFHLNKSFSVKALFYRAKFGKIVGNSSPGN